eukprot:SM000013S26506  [mRNA]  locus=s13:764047:765020:- [translate_table: standard]
MMRLVWWRDALANLYKHVAREQSAAAPEHVAHDLRDARQAAEVLDHLGAVELSVGCLLALRQGTVQEHPVLQALAAVLASCRLSKPWLDRIVEARIQDVEHDGAPQDILALEAYAESTASSLLYLTLQAAGVASTHADHAASHVGKAAGMTLLLRAAPHHHARRRTYIPLDTAAKHRLSQEDLYSLKPPREPLADAVLDIASQAQAHLATARAMLPKLKEEGLLNAAAPTLLPAVPAATYLAALERRGFHLLDPALARGVCATTPLWLQLQLFWHSRNQSF